LKIELNKKILSKNDQCAKDNRELFAGHKVKCFNVISSPGSGKTTTLSQTIRDIGGEFKIGVIEGDIHTDTDAAKIRLTGAPAVQIETKGSCHLSAEQVKRAVEKIGAAELDLVFIENVGNLVCPSDFDLGEHGRVVLLSVTEGDDKPIKYPATFAKADVFLITKIDLSAYIDFSIDRVIADIRVVNPDAEIIQVSATTGQGMDDWYDWIRAQMV
jgi:hydrogenase nickel incorporation protein HypB